ncbi:MAG: nitroreductase family protein [Bacteroidales bacterium]|jgi:nitroreductase|nr:nitroreductase family protein [Bacteroidales bacterium]
MDFKELIKVRQSCRAYQDRAVEREKIEMVLDAGRLAPSANNAQDWTFVAIDDAAVKQRIADCAFRMGGSFVRQAPVIIAVVAEKPLLLARLGSAVRQVDFVALNMGIAAVQICLQAADIGLGTCMLESFDEQKVKTVLNIPDSRRIALMITLGYSADPQRAKKRRSFSEVVSWNAYSPAK